jgi:uncharacterized protein (DUF4415 family)
MTRKQQSSRERRDGRKSASPTTGVRPNSGQRSSSRRGPRTQVISAKKRRSTARALAPEAQDLNGARLPMANPEFYRPLKKPVTLRLDADVLAWFRREGRRYQTRINQALRQVMEQEVKKPRR